MSKITQKNYEAIAIYRQKEKLFELKGKIQSLETEKAQLKELLKECREILDYAKDFAYHDPCCKCITKINQALGEE